MKFSNIFILIFLIFLFGCEQHKPNNPTKLNLKTEKKYNNKDNVPRPNHWSGWNLKPSSIEFWLDGDNRIHERLKYVKDRNGQWIKSLLSP